MSRQNKEAEGEVRRTRLNLGPPECQKRLTRPRGKVVATGQEKCLVYFGILVLKRTKRHQEETLVSKSHEICD